MNISLKTNPFRLLGLLALFSLPTLVHADSVELELYRQAPKILKTLTDNGYKNVGILRFQVQTGDAKPTAYSGTLNLDLANRLTIALVLQCRDETTLGILRDASAVAANLPDANHLTEEGRAKLFAGKYPLAWGDKVVEADAFVTGVVKLSKDLRKLTVDLWIVDKKRGLVKDALASINADVLPGNLVEAGESFLLRGMFDKGKLKKAKVDPAVASIEASKVQDLAVDYPLAPDSPGPIDLEVLYSGKKVPLEIKNGKASIAEPQTNEQVVFVVKRKGASTDRYKIVLKVNGLNTIEKERLPDLRCRGWVLEPGTDSITIKGFQIGDKMAEEFQVLSKERSAERAIYYGADVGTISLVVFAENASREKPKFEPASEGLARENASVIHGATFPPGKVESLDMLQSKLRDNVVTRGIIEGVKQIPMNVVRVNFVPDPTPVMSAVIRYYRRPL